MKVGKNTQLQSIHKLRNEHATKQIKRAREIVNQYYPIANEADFEKDFCAYLKKQIAGAYISNQVESQIDWKELALLNSIYQEYKVNFDAYSYDLILETPQQIEAWKMLEKICNVINNEHELAVQIYDPKKEFSRIKCIVFESGKFVPSFSEVKSLFNT